ncbi:MAG: Holliday junction resolvase RuvX [Candidatus Azosocius agrarius]|nr:MAG: Holliday junction resolvase RuvX [Gammaproteobacteria bacterium]
MNKYVIGFDFGLKYIGLAVGEHITNKAWPLKTLWAYNGIPNWILLDKLIFDWNPSKFVLGVSYGYYLSSKTVVHYAKIFKKNLNYRYNLPIYEINEDFTTYEAKKIYKQNKIKKKVYEIHSLSAAVILESWLNY